jgi:hypothetical protein
MRFIFPFLFFLFAFSPAGKSQQFHFIYNTYSYQEGWGIKWSVENESTYFTYEIWQFKKDKWEKLGEVRSAGVPDTLVYFFPLKQVKKGTSFFKIRTTYGNESNIIEMDLDEERIKYPVGRPK